MMSVYHRLELAVAEARSLCRKVDGSWEASTGEARAAALLAACEAREAAFVFKQVRLALMERAVLQFGGDLLAWAGALEADAQAWQDVVRRFDEAVAKRPELSA